MRWRLVASSLALTVGLLGCGGGGGTAGTPTPPGPASPVGPAPAPPITPAPPGATAPPAPAIPQGPQPAPAPADAAVLGAQSVELPLRRLSAAQYANALHDVTLRAMPSLSSSQAASLASAIASAIAAESYPADAVTNAEPGALHGGYTSNDQRLTQQHVDAAFAVGRRVGALVTASATLKSALVGSCATDTSTSNDAACMRTFVSNFGRLAFRRPLTSDEVDFFATSVAAADGRSPVNDAAVSDVVAAMFNAPQFLYLIENGQPTVTLPSGDRVPLTAHELAARLSFLFWQTVPDDKLSAAADSGALLTPVEYQAQVNRLAADARAEPTVREFFTQWLRLNELEPLDTLVGTQPFDTFRGSFRPTAQTAANAVREVADMTAYLFSHGGSLQDVLTDRRVFARGDIATLYGETPWDPSTEPQLHSDPARVGLITRIAFLASGLAGTRPIIKGLLIRTGLLCQRVERPPAAANGVVVELSDTLTTREVVESLTQTRSECAGCHQMQINPLGFVTENFDALGRTRTQERLFDRHTGAEVAPKSVNTIAPILINGPIQTAAGAADALRMIAASGEFERCFSQQYFRYAFGRLEGSADAGVLQDLRATALARRPLSELLPRLAQRIEFQTKDMR